MNSITADLPPGRSEAVLLELVHGRARQLRTRRRGIAATALVVVACMVAVPLIQQDSGRVTISVAASREAREPDRPVVANFDDTIPVVLERPPFPPPSTRSVTGEGPSLTLLSETANGITDTDAWFAEHGLSLPIASVEHAPRWYPREYRGHRLTRVIRGGEATILLYAAPWNVASVVMSVNPATRKPNYVYDFGAFVQPPDFVPDDRDFIAEDIVWAAQVGNTLYVSHAHPTYASSSKGMNAYITAVDLTTNRLAWRSDALTANAYNFEVVGGFLLAGYGFTAEDDFLYVLDMGTGETALAYKVKSAPEYLIRVGSELYVRTYDTDYVFRIDAP
jgi:hypothetical protein